MIYYKVKSKLQFFSADGRLRTARCIAPCNGETRSLERCNALLAYWWTGYSSEDRVSWLIPKCNAPKDRQGAMHLGIKSIHQSEIYDRESRIQKCVAPLRFGPETEDRGWRMRTTPAAKIWTGIYRILSICFAWNFFHLNIIGSQRLVSGFTGLPLVHCTSGILNVSSV